MGAKDTIAKQRTQLVKNHIFPGLVGRVDRASSSDALGSGSNPAPSKKTTSLPRRLKAPRGAGGTAGCMNYVKAAG